MCTNRHRRVLSRWLAASLAIALGACAADLPTAGGDPPAQELASWSAITLLTGDRVRLLHVPGAEDVIALEPGPGRERIGFVQTTRLHGGERDVSIVPRDALPLVAAGVLDPRLFDVSELARQRLTDADRDTLPLLVGCRPGAAALAPPLPSTGARLARSLPSIDGAALVADKADAAAVWRWLAPSTGGAAPRALRPGVDRVWLDGRRRLLDDVSNPQIGAPVAWQAGFTGRGVTVAVLDGGYDPDHPDLAGQVVGAVDFTESPDGAVDHAGHGTHVATTIAGTGAASGGRYRGVAPEAKLLIGKVCGDDGYCLDSAILAGMEWAVAQRATAVNMSLGGGPTDGTDPMAEAVNHLTDASGTLFVIAAGNSGADDSVGSPGSADAALTVGSVDKTDHLSPFSSRGPRTGDRAIKPDLAAPGQEIIAGRAAGTALGQPIDDHYTILSGTSMATPHVTGAVALLAQAHPGWTAPRLKAALMSSATPLAGMSVYAQGSGRLDVGRAVAATVHAEAASLSFGSVSWPHDQPAVTRTITYRNDGDADVTLQVAVAVTAADGAPAPSGLFTLGASAITVPAHGTAGLPVTFDPAHDAAATYGGVVTATGGGAHVVVAIGATEERESYDLSVQAPGAAADFDLVFVAVHLGTGETFYPRDPDGDGVATQRVPAGRYDLLGVAVGTAGGASEIRMLARPQVEVRADTAVVLDAGAARQVTVAVDQPAATVNFSDLSLLSIVDGRGGSILSYLGHAGDRLYATPTARVDDHRFAFSLRARLADPAAPTSYVYRLAFDSSGRVPAGLAYRVRDRDLAVVDAAYHVQGAPTQMIRGDYARVPSGAGSASFPFVDQTAPAVRREYLTAGPTATWLQIVILTHPDAYGAEVLYSLHAYPRGRQRAPWNAAPIGPALGDPTTGWGARRVGDRIQAAIPLFSPADADHYTASSGGVTGTTTLARDGVLIGSSDTPGTGDFAVPAGAGTYTLRAHARRDVPWSILATELDASWTFRSTPPADAAPQPLPLLVVRATTAVGLDGAAVAGRPALIGLRVERQPPVKPTDVARLALDVSFDDGARWRPTPVVRFGPFGWAIVTAPAAGGFVSLRTRAADAAGNTVEQTVVRAYAATRSP